MLYFNTDASTSSAFRATTLEHVSKRLAREGYNGPFIKVFDHHGQLRGWADSKNWKAV